MTTIGRISKSRWALSFADLCLLLLGFFVLLQSDPRNSKQAIDAIGNYFGALDAPKHQDFAASDLFQPGEALLSERGKAQLLTTVGAYMAGKGVVELQSFGNDSGRARFDSWDLGAARLGAVARALQQAGLPDRRIRIVGLAEAPAERTGKQGQTIRLLVRQSE